MIPYGVQIGSRQWPTYWHKSDESIRALVDRWIRVFWNRHRASIHAMRPGSMADATDNAWYDPPRVEIWRYESHPSGVIKCDPPTLIVDCEVGK